MSAENDILLAVQHLSGTKGADKVYLISASVESVDETTRTCVVDVVNGMGQTKIENVLLMSGIDDGMFLVPAIGSTVFVSYSTFNQPFVSLFSELQKVVFIVGDYTLQMTSAGVQFNGGSLGGLVKVIDLTAKLNNLENKVNALITAYNGHIHPASSGTTSPTTSLVTGTLTPTQQQDIENGKIKQ